MAPGAWRCVDDAFTPQLVIQRTASRSSRRIFDLARPLFDRGGRFASTRRLDQRAVLHLKLTKVTGHHARHAALSLWSAAGERSNRLAQQSGHRTYPHEHFARAEWL
jgi:integrase